MLGSSMPKSVPKLSWVLQDPEVTGQYLCGFAVHPNEGYLFKRVFVAVCRKETSDDDSYTLAGDVMLDGMIRMSDLKFIQKKER